MASRRLLSAPIILSMLLLLQNPQVALACATCGCSELCAVNMLGDSLPQEKEPSLLSNSIWGNMILKMAWECDPELQKLRRIKQGVNIGTASTLAAAAAGTLPQVTTSIVALNPPAGIQDSYTPGIVGLALGCTTNLVLCTRFGLNFGLHRKVRARQLAIKQRVESILQHLEFSETNCPEAQKQLAEIIGGKAASECIDLWQTCHAEASVPVAGIQ